MHADYRKVPKNFFILQNNGRYLQDINLKVKPTNIIFKFYSNMNKILKYIAYLRTE